MDRIRSFTKYGKRAKNLKASWAGYFNRDSHGHLYFTFLTSDTLWHLARLDENTGSVEVFEMNEEPYAMQGYMTVQDDKIRLIFKNKNDALANPVVYVLNIDEL